MLSRRGLFARLSTVALAPLAKLFGGRHPSLDAGVFYVVNPPVDGAPIPWRTHKVTRVYRAPLFGDPNITYDPSGSVTITTPPSSGIGEE